MIVDYKYPVRGIITEYKTTIQADVAYKCGCGSPVDIKVYKGRSESRPYRFVVTHRNRKAMYETKEPSSLAVLNKIIRVCSYAHCAFPLQ